MYVRATKRRPSPAEVCWNRKRSRHIGRIIMGADGNQDGLVWSEASGNQKGPPCGIPLRQRFTSCCAGSSSAGYVSYEPNWKCSPLPTKAIDRDEQIMGQATSSASGTSKGSSACTSDAAVVVNRKCVLIQAPDDHEPFLRRETQ
jgi:hypothetical protein